MVEPIRPDDVRKELPDKVIEVINGLIQQKWDGARAVILHVDAVKAIAIATNQSPSDVIDKGWADFEPVYRDAGWRVTYDRPGFNESYAATYTFERP